MIEKVNKIIKVCGLRIPENINSIAQMDVDMLGFIFYPPSKRYVGDSTLPMTTGKERVGVFVNQSIEYISEMIQKHSLTAIQLHGAETAEDCKQVKSLGVKLFKAISIATSADLELTTEYEPIADLFIFDTKCDGYGGSGVTFDWNILEKYTGDTPYLLSGGISPDDAPRIAKINDSRMLGVDLNSKFEIRAGEKNIDKLSKFIKLWN